MHEDTIANVFASTGFDAIAILSPDQHEDDGSFVYRDAGLHLRSPA